jgi:hypothetical protein
MLGVGAVCLQAIPDLCRYEVAALAFLMITGEPAIVLQCLY